LLQKVSGEEKASTNEHVQGRQTKRQVYTKGESEGGGGRLKRKKEIEQP